MPADIGQEHAGDATGGARRKIIDVAAAVRIFMRTGLNPNIQTGPVKVLFHAVVATPDLQTLHCFSHKSHADGDVGAPMLEKEMLTQGSLISQQQGLIADVATHVVRIVLVPGE